MKLSSVGIGPEAGPTLCYNLNLSPESVRSSIDLVDAFIESDGPFDGLLGFSQGGFLALSYLVDQAEAMASDGPSAAAPSNPPFKFAVLLSSVAAFSPDPHYCGDLVSGLTAKDNEILQDFPFGIDDDDYAALSPPQPERAIFFRSLGRLLSTCVEGGFIDPHGDLGVDAVKAPVTDETASSLDDVPRMFNTSLVRPSQLIQIPTVHVTGRKDDPVLVGLSQSMETLCEPRLMRKMTHEGGHAPPRSARDIKTLVGNVEWAIREGLMLANTM